MENNLIAGIGEVLWDIFPEYKQLGGATANFAYHTSQFGFNATVVSALGCDPLGDEIEQTLNTKRSIIFCPKWTIPQEPYMSPWTVKGSPATIFVKGLHGIISLIPIRCVIWHVNAVQYVSALLRSATKRAGPQSPAFWMTHRKRHCVSSTSTFAKIFIHTRRCSTHCGNAMF